MGPIAHLGKTETYEGKQRDYNPISVRPRSLSVGPICLGFVAVAMTFETRWRRIERIGGAEFDFWFRSNVDVGRWLRVLENITKHCGARNSLSNTSSLLDSIGFSYRLDVILDH